MTSADVTSSIWRFAGYWHIADETTLEREQFDAGRFHRSTAAVDGSGAHGGGLPDLAVPELTSSGTRFSNPAADAVGSGKGLVKLKAQGAPHSDGGQSGWPSIDPKLVAPGAGVGTGVGIAHHHSHGSGQTGPYTVEIVSGGNDKIIALHQINTLQDVDLAFGTASGMGPLPTDAGIADLVHHAVSGIPDVLQPPSDSTALPLAVTQLEEAIATQRATDPSEPAQSSEAAPSPALDAPAAEAERQPTSAAHPSEAATTSQGDGGSATEVRVVQADNLPLVPAGIYLNGESADQSTAPQPSAGGIATPAGPAPGADVEQLGGNTSINAASVIDANEATKTLVVCGDFVSTQVIVQQNLLADADHAAVTASTLLTTVSADDNQTDNWASFVHQTLDDDAARGPGDAGLHVRIEIASGDLYDIKAFAQTNWLSDSDVRSETSVTSSSLLVTGANGQVNLAIAMDLPSYDLIVVQGHYHVANWIIQTNILHDADDVALTQSKTPSDGPGSLVLSTSQNTLINVASITSIGESESSSIPSDIQDLLDSIREGGAIPAQAWWSLAGSAQASFHVLVVTGNYYDINVVSQTNVVDDQDRGAVEIAPPGPGPAVPATLDLDIPVKPGAEAPVLTPDTVAPLSSATVSTGSNTLINEAQIVDYGPSTALFVGGNHYQDSILIQANFVTSGDTLVQNDPTALVPELVAFTDPTEDAGVAVTDGILFKASILSEEGLAQSL
jgi:hypothetical protein